MSFFQNEQRNIWQFSETAFNSWFSAKQRIKHSNYQILLFEYSIQLMSSINYIRKV